MSTLSDDSMVLINNNHSYCDWRVTLKCENGKMYRSLYTINFIIIILIAKACIILLWYRKSRQGCTIFSPKIPGSGLIRPNPVEGFLVWAILWLIGRFTYIIILLSGILKDNYFALETLQEFYWSFCATAYAWFVVGTYLQIGSHLDSKQRPWRPNSKLSDRYLILTTVIRPMMIWPIAIFSGYFRDKGNFMIADTLISVRYILWGLWCAFEALGTLYFGRDLCNVLSYHIYVAKESNHITTKRVKRMQCGLGKIRFTVYIILITYLYYVIYCPIISIYRIWIIIHSESLNIFMFLTYAFFNPLCIIIVVTTISIRIIQGFKRESSPNISITKKLIEDLNINSNNNNTNNNNNTDNSNSDNSDNSNNYNSNQLINNNSKTSTSGLRRNRSVLTIKTDISELDTITSTIAFMDQVDDLVAYTQFNTANNVKQIVEDEEDELTNEKIDHDLIRPPELVVVRPASPTIPI